jgi:hypothetical protein
MVSDIAEAVVQVPSFMRDSSTLPAPATLPTVALRSRLLKCMSGNNRLWPGEHKYAIRL